MPQLQQPMLRRLGETFAKRSLNDLSEPLPERWVDLIHALNERERAEEIKASDRPRTLKRA